MVAPAAYLQCRLGSYNLAESSMLALQLGSGPPDYIANRCTTANVAECRVALDLRGTRGDHTCLRRKLTRKAR